MSCTRHGYTNDVVCPACDWEVVSNIPALNPMAVKSMFNFHRERFGLYTSVQMTSEETGLSEEEVATIIGKAALFKLARAFNIAVMEP